MGAVLSIYPRGTGEPFCFVPDRQRIHRRPGRRGRAGAGPEQGADRRLSRGRPACRHGGDGSADRRCGAPVRHRSAGAAPAQLSCRRYPIYRRRRRQGRSAFAARLPRPAGEPDGLSGAAHRKASGRAGGRIRASAWHVVEADRARRRGYGAQEVDSPPRVPPTPRPLPSHRAVRSAAPTGQARHGRGQLWRSAWDCGPGMSP